MKYVMKNVPSADALKFFNSLQVFHYREQFSPHKHFRQQAM
jgi:hypothetical protein